jgi:hypothetical protein
MAAKPLADLIDELLAPARAVGKLVLKQGPVEAAVPKRAPQPLDSETVARVGRQVSGVADPELRAALERLGQNIAQSTRHSRDDTAS